METILLYTLIIVAVGLMATILMQQSDSSMGMLFGDSDSDGTFRTRRGSEKILFQTSIVLAVAFAGLALTLFVL